MGMKSKNLNDIKVPKSLSFLPQNSGIWLSISMGNSFKWYSSNYQSRGSGQCSGQSPVYFYGQHSPGPFSLAVMSTNELPVSVQLGKII